MKLIVSYFFLAVLIQGATTALKTTCDTSYAIVANRGSGDLTWISQDGSQIFDLSLPSKKKDPEPMYVSYSRDLVFVGDRSNKALVVFNPKNLKEKPVVIKDVCDGIFHQWANENTIVIACDIDKTIAIISIDSMAVEATIELTDQGNNSISELHQKPHDIIITPSGDAIFVTILGEGENGDAILKINTSTESVVAKLDLPSGADPHLGLSANSPGLLYSPQQNLNKVAVYDQNDLSEVQNSLSIPHAHGIGASPESDFLYVTNIADGGIGAINVIKTAKTEEKEVASISGSAIDAPKAIPHNVAVTKDGYVFITHSGASATVVSAFSTNKNGVPVLKATYEAGANPFGIAIARYECVADVCSDKEDIIDCKWLKTQTKKIQKSLCKAKFKRRSVGNFFCKKTCGRCSK